MHTKWLWTATSALFLATNLSLVTAERYAVVRRDGGTLTFSTSSGSSTPTTGSASETPSPQASASSSITTSSTNADPATSVVLGATATPIANATLNGTITTQPVIDGLPIQPAITPALAVAGALLIATGAFYTLIGIKTKWLHIFLSTAYLFSLAVTILIIYVMHPPISNAIQGAYFLAACLTGIIFGAVAVIFADVTEGLGCFLGGFCLSMWLLVLKSGGLITSTAGKAIFIACFTLGAFAFYISHYTRPYGLIGSTSFAGATVVVLGIDCFSRAGLKEFWLYVWNLNNALFPLNYEGPYPITRGIRVEVASIVLLFLLGIMSQMKVWKIVKKRREERAAEQLRRDREQEQTEEDLGRRIEEDNGRERTMWDAVYSKDKKGSQADSGIGTDEPSTRKTSITDAREAADEGMELQSLVNARNGSTKGGRVTVHVAQDDHISEAPMERNLNSSDSVPKVSGEPSIHESNAGSRPVASEASSIKGTTKNSPIVIDPNLTLKPRYVPLPFHVPNDDSQSKNDDASSVATFAATEYLPERSSKRKSGSSLMRKLSTRSTQKSTAATMSEEALVVPDIEYDRASSMAATMSDQAGSSREALSSPSNSPSMGGSRENLAVDSPVLDVAGVAGSPSQFSKYSPTADKADGKDSPTGSTPGSRAVPLGASDSAQEPRETGSVKSAATSETSAQRTTRINLAGNLPEGASKVVMAYRTNEWAKHLEAADVPQVEDLKVNKPRAAPSSNSNERVAPVNVRALQQTPLTAEPAPIVTDGIQNMGDRAQLPSMNRAISASKNPYLNPQIRSTSNHSLTKAMDRTPSQTSLSSSHSREELSRPTLTKLRSSQTSLAPRNHRSSSTPLASSPIEEGVESSFPARFTPSPMHLMSQRDTFLRNKPSSTSLVHPSTNLNQSANSSNPALEGIDEDNIPLSHRRSLLQHNPHRTSSGSTTPYYTPALSRNPSQQSLPPRASLPLRTAATPTPRDSAISAWRASLAPSPQAAHQKQELEQRRAELLAEKKRRSEVEREEGGRKGQRESVVDQQMRRGSMMDAHREAMRRMQGQVQL